MSFHCVFLPCSTSGSCAGILADTLHQSDNLFTSRRAGLVGGGWGENKRFMEKPCRPPCRPLCRPPCGPPCPPPCRPSCQAGLVEGGWGENKRFMEKSFTQGTDCRPLLFHKMSLEQTNTIQNVSQQVLEREFLSSVFLVSVFVEYLSQYFDVDHLVNSERRLPFTLLKVVHGGFYGTRQRSTNTRNWRNRINYSQTEALQIVTPNYWTKLQIYRSLDLHLASMGEFEGKMNTKIPFNYLRMFSFYYQHSTILYFPVKTEIQISITEIGQPTTLLQTLKSFFCGKS